MGASNVLGCSDCWKLKHCLIDLEKLDRKKIPVSEWLIKLKAEEGMMSYRSWMLKMENLSRKK